MQVKIYVLVGMISSGKSTYATNAAKQGIITVNDDSVVNLVHGGDYTLYQKELKLLYKSTENHIIHMALALGRLVIVDRGLNISTTGRQRWCGLAKSMDIDCEAIVFPRETPEIHAGRRAMHDSRGHLYSYWLEVAKHHHSQYTVPMPGEGFGKIHHITWEEVQKGLVL